LVKTGKVSTLVLPSLGSASEAKKQKPKDTLGALSHTLTQVSPQRSLISAVAQTESFLQYLYLRVLRDYPLRLLSGTSVEQGAREEKLLEIIISSTDKREMLERVIEEKVRSLFYGAPSDFFVKDKAKLGFGDHFSKHFTSAIAQYAEITTRRNILIHNDGRVDRKYLREVPGTALTLGQKVGVDAAYLRSTLIILRGLCAHSGVLVCERIYNNKVPAGIMLTRQKTFKP
jgi:hypothetical protein